MKELSNLEAVALSKVIKGESSAIKAGSHEVDFVVKLHIKGEIKKGEDVTYTPTAEIPLLPTMALMLEKMGFMREKAISLLIESMKEAISTNEDSEKAIQERTKDIEEAMSHVRRITASLPKKIKSGATTAKLVMNILE